MFAAYQCGRREIGEERRGEIDRDRRIDRETGIVSR